MKVYTTTAFSGHWPVGTAAVIVAEDKESALIILDTELRRNHGLEADCTVDDLSELDVSQNNIVILLDGNY